MRSNDSRNEESEESNPLRLRDAEEAARERVAQVHVYSHGAVCDTEKMGHATPQARSPLEIVVDASEGFIPLWAENVTLRWRFQDRSMSIFTDQDAAKAKIRELFGEALLKWEDAVPVRFSERNDLWDFEIAVRDADRCSVNGCVLATAFFPDAGRHELVIYPKMFEQSEKEQVDTLIHEVGHIFGLRHFFAKVSEAAWPSEVFGEHERFSIMNYGADSELTETDKSDLKRLYESVWSGELTQINGTPIEFTESFSSTQMVSMR